MSITTPISVATDAHAPTCITRTVQHSHITVGLVLRCSRATAGFCTAYLVFIKENLASFTGRPANACVAALLPFLLALSTLRGVASLAPFSLVADAANAIGALNS